MDLYLLLCTLFCCQLRRYVLCDANSTNQTALFDFEENKNNSTRFQEVSGDETHKQHSKKSVLGGGGLLIPPPPLLDQAAAIFPPPIYSIQKHPGSYIPNIYTRVKMGYGTFYFNGRDAELRCNFPYNLKINSNFVWNKVTDNIVHFLDAYRVYERTYGHVSSLYIRDVQLKDFGIYACAVSGSFFPSHPVTFYQEVFFFPPQTLG